LKLALEGASNSSLISKNFLFDLPYCFGSEAVVELTKQADMKICSVYCPGSNGKCYLLKYDNKKDKVNPVRFMCVNISPIVVTNGDTCDDSKQDSSGTTYNLVPANPSVILQNGKYIFSSSSLSTSGTNPSLCIFSKPRGTQ